MESNRIKENCGLLWRYVDLRFYGRQLERYFDTFPSEQIKVILQEDMIADPIGQMQNLFGFIGVDRRFRPDVSTRLNVSGIPRNRIIYDSLRGCSKIGRVSTIIFPASLRKSIKRRMQSTLLEKPSIAPNIHYQLTNVFRDDIIKLSSLINRDLSHWLA